MVSNRNVTIKGVFAADASTTIPAIPVAGASYRDTTLTGTAIREGWAYKTIVDSAAFNEAMYEFSSIASLIEKYGFLPWSSLTNYETGSLCLGSNGVIYQAKQNTGPLTTAKDPTTDSANTYWEDFVGKTYVTKSGSNTITATNTFRGSNTFSGSVSLGSSATATTPAYSDSDTSVATTAMVHNLNDTQRTNCITEIPQDIKLTLSSGTLTLKSGSVITYADGTQVQTTTDKTYSTVDSGTFQIAMAPNNNLARFDNTYSGSTEPSNPASLDGWYDTTNNVVKRWTGSAWQSGFSLPIAIVTVSDGAISSIDKVFNGFGFIGSNVFVLPGVKGLIPDGRNADGSLKNTEFTTTIVKTHTQTSKQDKASIYLSGSTVFSSDLRTYDETNNVILNSSGQKENVCNIGSLTRESSSPYRITSFTPKNTFHAVDYSEFKEMISAIDQDTMKLTGDQSYSGIKTATTVNGIQATVSGSNNIIQNNTAASIIESSRQSDYVNGYTVYDKDARVAGMFGTIFRKDGGIQSFMRAVGWSRITQSPAPAYINLIVDNDGNVTTSAPTPDPIDNSSQIATTSMLQSWANTNNANCLSTWSKGGNGYFKFKNGLTIQFGFFSNNDQPITFPTAFSTTNYTILAACLRDVTDTYSMTYNNKTTTTVSIHTQQKNGNWLAIGY